MIRTSIFFALPKPGFILIPYLLSSTLFCLLPTIFPTALVRKAGVVELPSFSTIKYA
jgi:cell division protein FtsX